MARGGVAMCGLTVHQLCSLRAQIRGLPLFASNCGVSWSLSGRPTEYSANSTNTCQLAYRDVGLTPRINGADLTDPDSFDCTFLSKNPCFR